LPHRDDFGRAINYLRVSVTDRCNLRCIYCMPPQGIEKRRHGDLISYEQLALLVRAAADLGIAKVRITGGEPLVRLGLPEFVRMVAAISGIDDLSMTTNGTLLARYAASLAEAGLQRINISLDTLRADRFATITRRGQIKDVWSGIAAAHSVGLAPIKINMVVVRHLNDDEVADFARRTITHSWHVRFIELMPIGPNLPGNNTGIVPIPEIKDRLSASFGRLEPVTGPQGNGPARYYRLPGADGTVGFIGARSEHFCHDCNRLRLTADARLRPCLMSEHEIDLSTPVRSGASLEELKNLMAGAIHHKPERHHLAEALGPLDRSMAQIGG
jgi:cyclic pyranopterin phosphate synthase